MTGSRIPRFLLVLVTGLAVIALALLQKYGWGLAVGVAVGAVFFLRGMAAGGGLGNARGFGKGNADVSTRLGVCLAAAGIAAGALGHDPPFPLPFRVFYGVCLGLACAIGLFLAGRAKP